MFVKICGITDPADAVAAVEAGADAVGMIFAPSRRLVDAEQAEAIVDAVAGRALCVGVFRGNLLREVLDTVAATGIDAVQLHDADPALSNAVHAAVPILISAFAAGSPDLAEVERHGADVVMLDAPVPGGGVPFDWSLVGDLAQRTRLLLAGGLRPETVADAIATVRPWGVDVASGVEASPGRKDHDAVRAFVTAARAADPAGSSPHPPLPPPRIPR